MSTATKYATNTFKYVLILLLTFTTSMVIYNADETSGCIDLNQVESYDDISGVIHLDEEDFEEIELFLENDSFTSIDDILNLSSMDETKLNDIIMQGSLCLKDLDGYDEYVQAQGIEEEEEEEREGEEQEGEEDGDNNISENNEEEDNTKEEEEEGLLVPKTFTNMYNIMLAGLVMIVIAGLSFVIAKRQKA